MRWEFRRLHPFVERFEHCTAMVSSWLAYFAGGTQALMPPCFTLPFSESAVWHRMSSSFRLSILINDSLYAPVKKWLMFSQRATFRNSILQNVSKSSQKLHRRLNFTLNVIGSQGLSKYKIASVLEYCSFSSDRLSISLQLHSACYHRVHQLSVQSINCWSLTALAHFRILSLCRHIHQWWQQHINSLLVIPLQHTMGAIVTVHPSKLKSWLSFWRVNT